MVDFSKGIVMKYCFVLLLYLAFILSGCATTQVAPKSLDDFSNDIKIQFNMYKRKASTHRAFAVAKYGKKDFFGFSASYPNVEEAEARALDECYKYAKAYRYDMKCFIFHSE